MTADVVFIESQRERRGHPFFPTARELITIPQLYATEGIPFGRKIVHLHYFAGSCDWYVVEVDPETGLAFAHVNLGDDMNAEWGSVSLRSLEEINLFSGLLVVERDLHWEPRRYSAISR